MLVDANLLLFAVDRNSPFHERTASWLTDSLNGGQRVGFACQSLGAFLRIATHPRASENPMTSAEAWEYVDQWLSCDVAWVPEPGPRYAEVLSGMLQRYSVTGNLVPDTLLAALAFEHGLTVCSADTDFARFKEVRWLNPVD